MTKGDNGGRQDERDPVPDLLRELVRLHDLTNQRLDQTNQRLDKTVDRLDKTIEIVAGNSRAIDRLNENVAILAALSKASMTRLERIDDRLENVEQEVHQLRLEIRQDVKDRLEAR